MVGGGDPYKFLYINTNSFTSIGRSPTVADGERIASALFMMPLTTNSKKGEENYV